jgi:hypothetical protein
VLGQHLPQKVIDEGPPPGSPTLAVAGNPVQSVYVTVTVPTVDLTAVYDIQANVVVVLVVAGSKHATISTIIPDTM